MHRIVCCWKYSPPSQQRASVLSNHGRWLFNAASLQDSAGNFSSSSSHTIAISSGASAPIRQAGEHRIQYPTQRAPAWCVTPSPRTISAQESWFRSLGRSCPFTMAREEQPNGTLNPHLPPFIHQACSTADGDACSHQAAVPPPPDQHQLTHMAYFLPLHYPHSKQFCPLHRLWIRLRVWRW
jgi:hypothetical protein